MVLLIDADSLVFSSCYKKKQNPEDYPYFTKFEDAVAKFDEVFTSMINDIEEMYEVERVIVFNGARGNFRKLITPTYKANRSDVERPPFLFDLHNYVSKQYDSVNAFDVETDDAVARYWYELSQTIGRDNVMIVSLDKDYKQFPCLYYNYHYKHKVVLNITEEEALYNFFEQMIAGDGADNVNYFYGKGKSFCKKYYKDCKTEYQYRRKLYELFKKEYKGKAKEKYAECYNLLKLRTV